MKSRSGRGGSGKPVGRPSAVARGKTPADTSSPVLAQPTARESARELPPLGGPPPVYRREYAEQVANAARVGASRADIMLMLGVNSDVILLWSMVHSEFALALRANEEARTARVEDAMFQRSIGYEFIGEQIVSTQYGIERVIVRRHLPPDQAAGYKWLEASKPEKWKRKEFFDGDESGVLRVQISGDPGPSRMRDPENQVKAPAPNDGDEDEL
jgi:hypothetical protein